MTAASPVGVQCWLGEDQLDGYIKHVIHHGKGVQSVDDMSARVANRFSRAWISKYH